MARLPRETVHPLSHVREQTIEDLVRVGILDMAFHAGIDLKENRQALEEIVQKFSKLLPESEQAS